MNENIKYETFEQFWDDNYGKEFGFSDKCPSEPYYSIAEYSWEIGENHGYYLGKDYGDTKEIKEDNSIPSLSEFESNILKATNKSEEHEERIEKFFNELYTTYKPYLDTA